MSKYAIIPSAEFDQSLLSEKYPVVDAREDFVILEYNDEPDPKGEWFIFESAKDCQSFMEVHRELTPEERKAKVEDLVAAAEAFGLGEFIQKFFFKHRNVIQDYILNGGSALYELFLTDESKELDYENEEGISPRMYALALLDIKPEKEPSVE